jgi:hypothetical protein
LVNQTSDKTGKTELKPERDQLQNGRCRGMLAGELMAEKCSAKENMNPIFLPWHVPSRSRIRQNSGVPGDSPDSGEFSYCQMLILALEDRFLQIAARTGVIVSNG